MKSDLPKPLHPVAGLPMLAHVLDIAESLTPDEIVVVASPDLLQRDESEVLRSRARFVVQDPPRGTGDAVLQALSTLAPSGKALIVYADHPLVAPGDLRTLIDAAEAARVGLLTCVVDDAAGYGRIERDDNGVPVAIIEKVADDPARRAGRTEINSGVQLLDVAWATETLRILPPNPIKNEVFLTDLVAVAYESDARSVVAVEGSPETLLGVNDRAELAVVDMVLRRRIAVDLMRAGVSILGPETVFIDAGVDVGAGTVIRPNSLLTAGTKIGRECVIGPFATIEGSTVGDRSVVEASFVRSSTIGSDCHVGPWSNLRNDVLLDDHVHVGNFVELKASHLHSGVRAGHVSYLGDASIGEETNIGAGTITCNFDGTEKHRTTIGARAFIGSDTMLVAPLTVGDDAATGAGSVVTKDVNPGATVVGIPARQIRRQAKGE
ncbi:MAG: bifunctional UDP-N-acetylglucosamine diphosphorylase/glucosamine-1-phosphate N-acetyltransferase GlmU [Thermomicrobiales bacterium]|nr:bifunctional UDP-N-acetylglucosamine diphosphorylase/glucosamine-1-phosphate N-acetyltransferase GlmU [Thermomicrobiales bacterium]